MKFVLALTFLFLLFSTDACKSQSNNERESINLTHTMRVDLENEDTKKVFRLWESYLSASPHENMGSDHWSAQQKKLFPDTDLTRLLINYQLLQHYEPHVLSIEPKQNMWEIRTIYRTKSQEERFQSSNPWAIQTVYAGYEDEELKLYTALPFRTSDWNSFSLGNVINYYDSEHIFDVAEAERTQKFIEEVTDEFKVEEPEQISFYIADHPDDIMNIIGFDFILGPTAGFANAHNNMILSGKGSAWYPHEVTHILFKEFDSTYFLNEGIATMLGGTMGNERNTVYKKLKQFVRVNPEITLKQIIETQFFEGTNLYFYAAGASVCEFVYQEYGPEQVVLMLNSVSSDGQLFPYLQKLMNDPNIEIEEWWKDFIVSF